MEFLKLGDGSLLPDKVQQGQVMPVENLPAFMTGPQPLSVL